MYVFFIVFYCCSVSVSHLLQPLFIHTLGNYLSIITTLTPYILQNESSNCPDNNFQHEVSVHAITEQNSSHNPLLIFSSSLYPLDHRHAIQIVSIIVFKTDCLPRYGNHTLMSLFGAPIMIIFGQRNTVNIRLITHRINKNRKASGVARISPLETRFHALLKEKKQAKATPIKNNLKGEQHSNCLNYRNSLIY